MAGELIKPKPWRPGSRVAVASSSAGSPARFPATFDAGIGVLRDVFGLEVVEAATARMSSDELAVNPRLRAETLNDLFADPEIDGILSSIGGNESVRILPWLDTELAAANPKIYLGYSDTAAQTVAYHLAGLVTFNGPAVMAGFAQLENFPEAIAHVRTMLFGGVDAGEYEPYPTWVERYQDWNDAARAGQVGDRTPHDGWRWLNGTSATSGRLFGGCIEVLEMLKGTRWWPNADPVWWRDRVLFLETSEDKPTVESVSYWLRNYGAQGAFDEISALWFGRARSYTPQEKAELDQLLVDMVVGEFGRHDLPIVSNLDFGHTDP